MVLLYSLAEDRPPVPVEALAATGALQSLTVIDDYRGRNSNLLGIMWALRPTPGTLQMNRTHGKLSDRQAKFKSTTLKAQPKRSALTPNGDDFQKQTHHSLCARR